ncbi:hypothetical protein, partial [Planifilum fimeticola]|uniref:hypothetical protein n=1 Tax=Planifilum fimeticola TaxID=201975 RepID=UPI001B80629C
RVTEQCLLTAVCQNIKKMALLLWKRNNGPQGGSFIRLFFSIFFQLAYKPSGFSAGFVNSLRPSVVRKACRNIQKHQKEKEEQTKSMLVSM